MNGKDLKGFEGRKLKVDFDTKQIKVKPQTDGRKRFKNKKGKNDLKLIETLLTERVGSTIKFRAVECDNLKLTPRGKAPLIINTISV